MACDFGIIYVACEARKTYGLLDYSLHQACPNNPVENLPGD